ncbi:unnamed protein product [Arctogadus glacialis]
MLTLRSRGSARERALLSHRGKAPAQDFTVKAHRSGTLPVPLLNPFLRSCASGSSSLRTAALEDVTKRRLGLFLKLEGDAPRSAVLSEAVESNDML